MATRIPLPFVFFLAALAAGQAEAQTSATIPYRGHLEQNGAAWQGSADLQFRMLRAGDVEIWCEEHDDVAVVQGAFAVALGAGTPCSGITVNEALAGETEVFLAIGVRDAASTGAYLALGGRQRLGSVPFAHHGAPERNLSVSALTVTGTAELSDLTASGSTSLNTLTVSGQTSLNSLTTTGDLATTGDASVGGYLRSGCPSVYPATGVAMAQPMVDMGTYCIQYEFDAGNGLTSQTTWYGYNEYCVSQGLRLCRVDEVSAAVRLDNGGTSFIRTYVFTEENAWSWVSNSGLSNATSAWEPCHVNLNFDEPPNPPGDVHCQIKAGVDNAQIGGLCCY